MHFANPFALPGRWFKGNLHVHSTGSDGELTPDEVIDWYQERGYHFLAITDHDVLAGARTVADDFITISGIEMGDVDPKSGLYHVVGLGLAKPPGVNKRETIPLQEAINRLRVAGAQVFLAHPYWSGQMSKDLLDLEGCFGLEIYNGGCEADSGKELSMVHWDDLLAAGRRWWGLAVDDAHWRNGDKDAGPGWVWVKAEALTQEAILDALQQGCFYASSGPQIHDLQFDAEQRRVYVCCSPTVAIDFAGNGPHSHRVMAPPGETLIEARHRLQRGQRYVRVACQDHRGCWAWSNPIFLDGRD
jgi:hypothetical protein